MDFFTVPTSTFQCLWVFFVLHPGRRQVLHFSVKDHPVAQWIVQELREAFLFDRVPRYAVHLAALIDVGDRQQGHNGVVIVHRRLTSF